MGAQNIFDRQVALPDDDLTLCSRSLVGFEQRYDRVHKQLRLLISGVELSEWNKKHHGGKLALVELVAEQYPLVVFHGDVGTGKTAMAECIANKLATEIKNGPEPTLFKLSNRVRGSGMVGEMGTLIAQAFSTVVATAGKHGRAILIIDEADSLAAARSQQHSHHEDKVAVNTLIQCIDDLRRYEGRIVVILCTNRLSAVDPAVQRRAAIVDQFDRPSDDERTQLFENDLSALKLSKAETAQLVAVTGPSKNRPGFTFSDLRTRLYPSALSQAYPECALTQAHLLAAAQSMMPSPIVEDL